MKMSPGLIFGVIIILIGLGIIFKLPIFRILIGALLLFLGIKVIFGGFSLGLSKWSKTDAIFTETLFTAENLSKNEYNVVFAKGVFDMRNIDLNKTPKNIKLNTIFAASEIILNPDIPCKITINSAFAGANLPNGNSIAFGTLSYMCKNYNADTLFLELNADVVFGSLDIHY
jgi:hypothetical protein